MSAKPSICFFNKSPSMPHMLMSEGPAQAGGAEIRAALLARNLVKRGWPVSFIVCDYGQADEMTTPEGIRVIKSGTRARFGIGAMKLLTQTLPADMAAFKAANADVYLETGVSWRTGVLAYRCRRERRKFLLWLASITDPYAAVKERSRVPSHGRWMAKQGLRHAEVVVAQTHEQAEAMRQLFGRECPVIPNVWEVTPSDGVKADPPEVFWAARYLPLKRPELVLETARLLPDTRFVMAGGPAEGQEAYFEEMQKQAAELPNVEALGFVPFSEIDTHYSRASVYLCTSTIEGFPNTFLQAWNHYSPVVSTYDPDDVLEREGVGIACETAEELAAAVSRATGDEGRAMGQKAREYLERVHSVDAVLGMLEPLLDGAGG